MGRVLFTALGLLVFAFVLTPSGFGQAPGVEGTMSDSLVIDNDGDGSADPGDTLRYTVEIGNATGPEQGDVGFEIHLDPNTILVPGSVRVSPLALDDHYDAVGNTPLSVPAVEGLLANDRDPNDPAMDGVAVTGYDVNTAAGGIAVVDATGGFTYVPPPGYRGLDAFGYTITDADGFNDSATAAIAIDTLVWFVDNTAPPDGPGTIVEPFDALADVELVAATDDVIYIFSGDGTSTGLDSRVVLEPGQRLLGQGVDLVIGQETLVRAATAPVLSATSGTAITLAGNTEVSGLAIDSAQGTGILGEGLAGPVLISSVTVTNHVGDAVRLQNGLDSHFHLEDVSISTLSGAGLVAGDIGSVTFASPLVSALSGPAVQIVNAGIGIEVAEVSSSNSPGHGILLDGVSGYFVVTARTTISSPETAGINVRSSDGAAFLFGDTEVTGAGNGGVELTNNSGALCVFAGLRIQADGGTGLRVQDSNILNIGGADNMVNALEGTGVHVSNTVLGLPQTVFTSVSSSGGTNGILLNNTGDGRFIVTGDGSSPGSGGTIQNTIEDGIRLENLRGVSLSRMNIFSTGGGGVRGTSVADFSIEHSQLMNIGDADGEYGIGFANLRGTNAITNTSMTNVADTNVSVENTSGALDVLTLSNGTFVGGVSSEFSGSGIFVRASGTATIGSVTVADMTFRDMDGAGIDARAGVTSGLAGGTLGSFAVERCTVENVQAGGVFFITEGHGEGTFSLRDCPLLEAVNAPVLFIGANDFSQTTATVAGNVFSMNRTQDFGYTTVRILNDSEGGSPTTKTTFHSNNVSGSDAEGIYAQSREGNSRLDLRITDNTVSSEFVDGIFVRSGSGSPVETDTLCLEISGNSSIAGDPFLYGILLYQEGPDTQFLLRDYTGDPTDSSAITAFIEANNAPSTADVRLDAGYGSGDCTTPSP